MPRPAKPAVPPPPLRSNPESFSARMEASLLFWDIFASYLDELGQFAEAQASAALAAATGGDLPPLTGQAGKFLRVKSDGGGVEFRKALALADSADGSDLALTGAGRAFLAAADAAAQRLAIGAAALASPAFTGTPTAPTQAAGNSSTRLATTAFVQQALTGVDGKIENLAAGGAGAPRIMPGALSDSLFLGQLTARYTSTPVGLTGLGAVGRLRCAATFHHSGTNNKRAFQVSLSPDGGTSWTGWQTLFETGVTSQPVLLPEIVISLGDGSWNSLTPGYAGGGAIGSGYDAIRFRNAESSGSEFFINVWAVSGRA